MHFRVLESPSDLAQTMCGTLAYMSPEAFAGIPYTTKVCTCKDFIMNAFKTEV